MRSGDDEQKHHEEHCQGDDETLLKVCALLPAELAWMFELGDPQN